MFRFIGKGIFKLVALALLLFTLWQGYRIYQSFFVKSEGEYYSRYQYLPLLPEVKAKKTDSATIIQAIVDEQLAHFKAGKFLGRGLAPASVLSAKNRQLLINNRRYNAGNCYFRALLVQGGRAVIIEAICDDDKDGLAEYQSVKIEDQRGIFSEKKNNAHERATVMELINFGPAAIDDLLTERITLSKAFKYLFAGRAKPFKAKGPFIILRQGRLVQRQEISSKLLNNDFGAGSKMRLLRLLAAKRVDKDLLLDLLLFFLSLWLVFKLFSWQNLFYQRRKP